MVSPLCDSQLLYHRPSISPTASQFVIADGIILRQNRLLSSSSFWGTKFGNTVKLGVSGCSSCSRKRSTSVNASLGGLLSGIFKGSDNGESTRQQYASIVASVNRLETEISALSDSELRERTDALKQRAQKGESMDSLLPVIFQILQFLVLTPMFLIQLWKFQIVGSICCCERSFQESSWTQTFRCAINW